MIRGPLKILKVEAILRGESRRSPAGLWITVKGLEHEPFVVLALGLVLGDRSDALWAHAPKRMLRHRGWIVSKKRPLSICFPLDTLRAPTASVHDLTSHNAIGVESVVIRLGSGIEMRQRIHEVAHEPKRTRRFLPRLGRDNPGSQDKGS